VSADDAGPLWVEGSTIPTVIDDDETRRRRLRPWAIAGAAVVVIVTGGVALSYTALFGARVIEVEGERHLVPRQVMRLADVGLGVNVLHLDEASVEARLEAEAWVLDAAVDSTLPGTIVISVQERVPMMVAAVGGTRRWISEDGTVLGRAPEATELPDVRPGGGTELDPGTMRSVGGVLQAMAPALRERVDEVEVFADDTLDLVVDGDVEVRYGSVRDATAKGQALRAILEFAARQERSLLSVDISAPAAPTARFVGSREPAAAPDPSADTSH
jgi:cell division protein FtsQ